MTQTDHPDCLECDPQPEEVAALSAQEDIPAPAVWKSRLRAGFVWFFTVAAALLIAVEAPLVWVNTTVLDTDGWMAATDSLASLPAVQDVVSTKTSHAITESLDMRTVVQEYLPERASFLAVPLADAVDSIIVQKTDDFVRSPAFPALWKIVDRNGHAALISVLTQKNEGAVRNSNGTVVLDTGVVAQAVVDALQDDGFALAGYIPVGSLDTDIVLFSSPQLANAQAFIGLLNGAVIVVAVLAVLFAVVACVLAKHRRMTLMRLALSIFIVMVVSVLVIELARMPLISSIPGIDAMGISAIDAISRAVLDPLLAMQRGIALVGLLVWALAFVAGRPFVLQKVGAGIDVVAQRVQANAFCQKVVLYRHQAVIAGCVVAGVIVLLPSFASWQPLLVLVVILVLWLGIIRGIVYLEARPQR